MAAPPTDQEPSQDIAEPDGEVHGGSMTPPQESDSYPYQEGGVTVIGPECFTAGEVICYRGENYYSDGRVMQALGWVAAELADRSGAWDDEAPKWFPEPPEWIELWGRALVATAPEDAHGA